MTDEDFLDAIATKPESDMHRLVYADWLEERGDVRAEFLRLDHELQCLSEEEEEYLVKESRWLDLWDRIDQDWIERILDAKYRKEESQLFCDLLENNSATPVLRQQTRLFLGKYSRNYSRETVEQSFRNTKSNLSRIMKASHFSVNRRGYLITDILGSDDWYIVLTEEEHSIIFRDGPDGWESFWKKFPNCGGLHSVSRAAFNPCCSQAMFYHSASFSGLAGNGEMAICVKSDGKWQRIEGIFLWIS